jgi:hypothetical protein
MNWFDIVLIVILFIFTWKGFRAGLVGAIGGFFGVIVGIWAGSHYMHQVGVWVMDVANFHDNEYLAAIIGFIAIFLAINITGSIIVNLQVASSETDGAFFAYLEDVAPNGDVTYITEGMLRAIHRKISEDPEPYVLLGPNHSFKRKDAAQLISGEITDISFKLFATSVQIKKGHSIRISLAGADQSIFTRFPKEGSPIWKVYRNSSHISSVTFPIRK